MTVRATRRGAERTPLHGTRADVLVCGASFAGLAVARELAASGADVLRRRPLRDRRAGDLRLRAPGAVAARDGRGRRSIRSELRRHDVLDAARHGPLPPAVELGGVRLRGPVRGLWAQCGRRGSRPPRSRAARRATGRRRSSSAPTAATCGRRSSSTPSAGAACSRAPTTSRRTRRSAAASRSIRTRTPRRTGTPWTSGSSATSSAAATAGACPPAARRGSGSAPTTRAGTSRSRRGRWPSVWRRTRCATRATGSRTGCAPAVEDDVFFVGDSAGHCFPLSGEGIRTAFYFGIAAGREIARCAGGQRRTATAALAPTRRSSDAPPPAFRRALTLQRLVPALPPRALTVALRALAVQPA